MNSLIVARAFTLRDKLYLREGIIRDRVCRSTLWIWSYFSEKPPSVLPLFTVLICCYCLMKTPLFLHLLHIKNLAAAQRAQTLSLHCKVFIVKHLQEVCESHYGRHNQFPSLNPAIIWIRRIYTIWFRRCTKRNFRAREREEWEGLGPGSDQACA